MNPVEDSPRHADFDESRYQAIVGEGAEYYLPRFRRFASGGLLSWNWAAFVATFAWLRYRKLRAWSWAYFFVSTPVLLALGILLISGGPDTCERALDPGIDAFYRLASVSWLLLDWVVIPSLANRLYYNRIRATLARTDAALARGQEPAPALAAISGTARLGPALTLQAVLLAFAFVVGPQYANYAFRAEVSNAFSAADNYKAHFEYYFEKHGRFPVQASQLGTPEPVAHLRSLALQPDGTIRATFGADAQGLSGRSFELVPSLRDGQIAWACRSDDLPKACLPVRCGPPP